MKHGKTPEAANSKTRDHYKYLTVSTEQHSDHTMTPQSNLRFCLLWMLLGGWRLRHNCILGCDFNPGPDGVIYADCARRGLTSFPVDWLPDVVNVDVSNNLLESLTRLAVCTLPGNLQQLDVSNNRLEVLHNDTFSCLTSLKSLSLSRNLLTTLAPDALTGLGKLLELDLSYNDLQYVNPDRHESLPVGVFKPLTSVQNVHLQYNNGDDQHWNGEYPLGLFGDLVTVQVLTLDTFYHLRFGSDFARLTSIQTLDLGSQCWAVEVYNDTFSAFRNSSLNALYLTRCNLREIQTCAFCGLQHLKVLRLDANLVLSPTVALSALHGLQGQNMDEINFNEMHRRRSLAQNFGLDADNARCLLNICVKRFTMRYSMLEHLSHTIFSTSSRFQECVEHLDFSENEILGDISIFMFFYKLQHLVSFRLESQRVYSLSQAVCIAVSDNSNCGNRHDQEGVFPNDDVLYFNIPTTLTYFNMSSASTSFNPPYPVINFTTADSLKVLDLSYGVLSNCLTTLSGLRHLETLDLSGNFCTDISDNIFDHLPSLLFLSLAGAHLKATDIQTRLHRLVRNLGSLHTLDLSRNALMQLQGRSLPDQPLLQRLILANNNFQSLPLTDLHLHPNLTVLDLSFNDLTLLTGEEMESLERIASTRDFSLQLRGNPLLCACSTMDFLQWLWSTSVHLDGDSPHAPRRYTCTTETGQITNTDEVRVNWEFVWRRCVGQKAFYFALAAFLVQMLGLVLAFLVVRHWTHLCYAWKVARNLRVPSRFDFRKDVYVVYADRDMENVFLAFPQCLRQHGVHRLLMGWEPEENTSGYVAENIVDNIDHSWKVLLLVTPAFTDDWACSFAVQQAQRSITDLMPDRVLVLFLEDPHHRPPPPMASLEMLFRRYPDCNKFYIPDCMPRRHPEWKRLALNIVGDRRAR